MKFLTGGDADAKPASPGQRPGMIRCESVADCDSPDERSAFSMNRFTREKSIFYITSVSCLASISIIAMYFEFPISFLFPSFYKFDFSTYPVIVGTFAMGPVAGISIQLIKDLIHMLISNNSMGVGQLADFLVSLTYILPAGLIYKKYHTKKGAIAATTISTVIASISGAVLNYVLLIPLFALVFNAPIEAFIQQGTAIFKYITDLKTFVIFATLPFNVLKFGVVSILTILTYKRISPLFKFIYKEKS